MTSARTTANGIYCPPKLQASLDLQSGILHAADEKDFKTAFSYFYEAFEGFDSIDSPKAITSLKYMLLSKIMLNAYVDSILDSVKYLKYFQNLKIFFIWLWGFRVFYFLKKKFQNKFIYRAEDINGLITGKLALKYAGREIESMKAIANSSQKRSLAEFQKNLEAYKGELLDDSFVRSHLDALYDNLLEQNLTKIIEPFSKCQIEHIAHLIKLPKVEILFLKKKTVKI